MRKRFYLPCLTLFMMINVIPMSMWASEEPVGPYIGMSKVDVICLLKRICTLEQKNRIVRALPNLSSGLRQDIEQLIFSYEGHELDHQERERIEHRLREAGLI